jgi:hypothetical protein
MNFEIPDTSDDTEAGIRFKHVSATLDVLLGKKSCSPLGNNALGRDFTIFNLLMFRCLLHLIKIS